MRTLVLGDPHNKIETLNDIIGFEKPDKTVIVGDFHDDWKDGASKAKKTAIWMKERLTDPKFVMLMGNHDAQYAFPYRTVHNSDNPQDRFMNSCGANRSKWEAIHRVFTTSDWHRIHLFHEEQGFVLSHAGIHPMYFEKLGSLWNPAFQQVTEEQFWHAPYQCWVNVVGTVRGGYEHSIGGALWCDYNYEFRGTPGVKQIFGHTHLSEVYTKDHLNYCIDCLPRGYLVLQDGTPIIYKWDPISKVGYED